MLPTPTPFAIALMLTILGSIVGAWIWVLVRLLLALPVLPPSTPRLVPWRGRSVVVAILFWLAINLAVPTAYRAVQGPGPGGPNANFAVQDEAKVDMKPGELMTLSAVQNAATLALVPLLLAATCRARPRDFGLADPGPLKQVARGVVAYPLLAPVVFGVMGLSILIWGRDPHPLEKAIGEDKSPGMAILLVLAGVVLAPIAEELVFRGIFLGWLTRLALKPKKPAATAADVGEPVPAVAEVGPPLMETVEIESIEEAPSSSPPETAELATVNPYAAPAAPIAPPPAEPADTPLEARPLPFLAANVLVSLTFAALHAPVWPTPIPIFFLSLGLGFLYQRTGSLLGPIALHMTFNGVSTALMFLMMGNDPAPAPGPKAVDPVPPPASVAFERPGIS